MKYMQHLFLLIVVLLPCLIVLVILIKPCPIIYPCYANEERSLYIVLVEGDSLAFVHDRQASSQEEMRVHCNSEAYQSHAKLLERSHNQLLQSTLDTGTYTKLHGFTHLANGFAVRTTPFQAEKLKRNPRVKLVQRDRGAKLMTTYTPKFLNLPLAIPSDEESGLKNNNNNNNAGEGIIIGFVDSGINPSHPSFQNYDNTGKLINNASKISCSKNSSRFCGACETGPRFPASSCNGKIVSARFFAAGAQAVSILNASVDFLSPFDAVGHGR